MLNDYIKLIELQRTNNPNFKKDYRVLTLPKQLATVSSQLDQLAKFPNAFLSNIIYRDIFLYKDTKDYYYYEFIDKGVGYNTNFEDWRYFYIPLSQFLAIENKLPSFKFYDIRISEDILTYKITQSILYINNNLELNFSLTQNNKLAHPLLNHFIFTGKCGLIKDGRMVYEYKDEKGYTDDETISYLSFIEPLNFYLESSNIGNNYLYYDNLLINNIGLPPSKLNIFSADQDLNLGFTGRVTNTNFSKLKKWYEYAKGSSSEQILLPYLPTNKDLKFINIKLYNKRISLLLKEINNNQNISINQSSSNKQIIIK